MRRGETRYRADPDACRALIYEHGIASIDLETRGLHPHERPDAAVGAIIVRAGEQTFIFRDFPTWWVEMMEDPAIKKIIVNAKFDLTWMIHASLMGSGDVLTQARNIADPMLKSQLSHAYRTFGGYKRAGVPGLVWEPNDLKSMLAERLGVTIGKTIDHDTTDWTGPWSDEMIDYMVEDIVYLEALNDTLDAILVGQGQQNAAAIEQEMVFGIAWMTYNGITPDVDRWKDAIEDWKARVLELHEQLLEVFPGVENFGSPKQIIAAAPAALGVTLLNTKKGVLRLLAPNYPAIALLLEFRHYQTLLKNWGQHYLDAYVCKICERIHPDWRQIGTETSRVSCSRPNLQQIPRAPEFRSLFVAQEGMVLASLDYSAIEVLVAAVFANDANLLRACATGNPHGATAAMGMGVEYDEWLTLDEATQEKTRQDAKIVNFGLLFGGGVDSLIVQARDLFNVSLSLEEAQRLHTGFFQRHPGLRRTRKMAYDAMKSREKRVAVHNAVGFRRYLEGVNRKATSWLNTWIQSTAGFGMKAAIPHLREAGLLPFLCIQVHDELVFEFPAEDAPDLVERARACLIQGMRDVIGDGAPVIVKDAVGGCWL